MSNLYVAFGSRKIDPTDTNVVNNVQGHSMFGVQSNRQCGG
jgi:hypothetical protein